MTSSSTPRFADFTTIGVGGSATEWRELRSTSTIVSAAREVWASGDPWLVCGGGSNLLVADEGFDGVVLVPRSDTVRVVDDRGARVVVEVDAGVAWDDFVAESVSRGWGGVEALSGIPGRVGAAPIQNIGAYGSEFSDLAVSVRFLEEGAEEPVEISAAACGFGYRSSIFKHDRSGVIVSVRLVVDAGGFSAPIRYAQLADRLGVPLGSRIPAGEVREVVLALRRSKGMVFDPEDPDTHGCGSFFVNPIVEARVLSSLPAGVPSWPTTPGLTESPVVLPLPVADSAWVKPRKSSPHPALVKLSAAWLIQNAGIDRGFRLPGSGAAVSSKHTLAITNRGAASAKDVIELARYIQTRVASEFGVLLQPEPRFVGVEL